MSDRETTTERKAAGCVRGRHTAPKAPVREAGIPVRRRLRNHGARLRQGQPHPGAVQVRQQALLSMENRRRPVHHGRTKVALRRATSVRQLGDVAHPRDRRQHAPVAVAGGRDHHRARRSGEARIGDIVGRSLREDRLFVHRVAGTSTDTCVTRGDALPSPDPPVAYGEVLGVSRRWSAAGDVPRAGRTAACRPHAGVRRCQPLVTRGPTAAARARAGAAHSCRRRRGGARATGDGEPHERRRGDRGRLGVRRHRRSDRPAPVAPMPDSCGSSEDRYAGFTGDWVGRLRVHRGSSPNATPPRARRRRRSRDVRAPAAGSLERGDFRAECGIRTRAAAASASP